MHGLLSVLHSWNVLNSMFCWRFWYFIANLHCFWMFCCHNSMSWRSISMFWNSILMFNECFPMFSCNVSLHSNGISFNNNNAKKKFHAQQRHEWSIYENLHAHGWLMPFYYGIKSFQMFKNNNFFWELRQFHQHFWFINSDKHMIELCIHT